MPRANSSLRWSIARPSPWLAFCVLILWFSALFCLRAGLVDAAFSPYVRCAGCFFLPSIAHDSMLLALALGLFAAVLLLPRWLGIVGVMLIGLLMLIVAADILVFKALTHRLLWSDAFKFVRDLGAIGNIGAESLQGAARGVAVFMGLFGAVTWILCLRTASPARSMAIPAGSIAAGIALLGWWARSGDPDYVNADVSFQNVIEVNLAQSINARYSTAFIERMGAAPALARYCGEGQQQRPDIVLVMVESLSNYHSRLFGGELDAMPQLDALASRGRWFPDHHANGFTTDGGMIALLGGLTPIPLIGRYQSMDAFAGYSDPASSVPTLLGRSGYFSAFFTTGDLGFVDKNRWLPAIGFGHFEGSESGFYSGRSRGIFGAARDALLFERFAQWLELERDRTRPFFATLLTVTTHPPFIDPETGQADEQGVFREVDTAIATLHQRLTEQGFFENGILLVTGDHRSMTPLRANEHEREGAVSFSRVPLYLWGPENLGNGRVDGKFQHSDLLPSLADLTLKEHCHHIGQGLYLRSEPVPAQFALHARGMPRDRIDVYTPDGNSALILAGDRSRWVGDKPAQWHSIEAMIHLQRAARAGGDSNVLETLIDLRRTDL